VSEQAHSDSAQRPGQPIAQPWTWTVEEVTRELDVDVRRGLSSRQARRRRHTYGSNHLHETAVRPRWRILLEQFKLVADVPVEGLADARSGLVARWCLYDAAEH
jgi:magnesium-transporting ATPase (P-type)